MGDWVQKDKSAFEMREGLRSEDGSQLLLILYYQSRSFPILISAVVPYVHDNIYCDPWAVSLNIEMPTETGRKEDRKEGRIKNLSIRSIEGSKVLL